VPGGPADPRRPGAEGDFGRRQGLCSREMQFGALSFPEQRVLGCLIEKRLTTPDQYPLSLNSLRLACNQSTNRNPVTDYDEATVRDAAQRLCKHGLARLASGHTTRAIKYRHLAEEALGLGREELSVLAVLLLRGPQTPGELKSRSERMAHLESLADVEGVLATLIERDYARRLDRRPGQKEDRFEQLLGEHGESAPAGDLEPELRAEESTLVGPLEALNGAQLVHERTTGEHVAAGIAAGESGDDRDLAARVRALEAEVEALREEIAALRRG
jgi:uncharacterized protein YceH (UPF0502 family)